MICYGIFTGCDLTTRNSYFTILLKFSWISFQHKTHISRIIYSKQNIRLWSQKPQISTKLFGIVTILKAFLSMISGIIPSLYWVKVFQTSFLQIAKTRQLRIQIFITWFTWAPEKYFIKLCGTCFQYLMHVWLIIFLFHIKLIRFEIQNIKFRLKSRIILIAFWKYFLTWHTQNIIWEKFKLLEYLLNTSPSFHEHFVLIRIMN